MKKILSALAILIMIQILSSCATKPKVSIKPGPLNPKVLIKTELGNIVVEIYQDKAPMTAANFLKYVDSKLYDGSVFHRTVTMDNQPNNAVKIEVIQGGQLGPEKSFPAIALERTSVTGINHVDGAISMARSGPDSATSSFFICIGDQPELDFRGKRNSDGQGFAALGKVIAGMNVVKKIHKSPAEGQNLKPPIGVLFVERIKGPDRVAVQHILIAFKGSIPEEKVVRTSEEARVLAVKLFERAKKGEDFDALVKKYTDDEYPGIYRMSNFGVEPNKEKKEYSRAGMVRSFGDVSFSLPAGGVGLAVYDPQKSKYGWHIIKRIE
ncbi:MAG: peptidylprolyl isomerase [Candidatus Aminicenantes bacterium]|nr:peptidylprolyl isomerase [Candidatus Aminicenantes bacterium]